MAKRTKTSVKNACTVLWAKVIRSLGRCEHCGRSPRTSSEISRLEAHHVYGKGVSLRLRLDLHNGCCLCHPCHRWAEGNPLEFTDWFRWYRPTDAEYLKEQHALGPMVGEDKLSLEDYLEKEQKLKHELERLT